MVGPWRLEGDRAPPAFQPCMCAVPLSGHPSHPRGLPTPLSPLPPPPGEVFHIPLSCHHLQKACLIAPCRLRFSSGPCPAAPGFFSTSFPHLIVRCFSASVPRASGGQGPCPAVCPWSGVAYKGPAWRRTREVLRMGVGPRAWAGGWSSHPHPHPLRTSFGR